jgi:putative chitinase
MKVTASQIKEILPANKSPEQLANALNLVLEKYEINTVNRLSGFLAQCGHESAGFTILKENLNYRAESLTKVFPKYFKSLAEAQQFEKNAEKIANKIYGGRMGNGDEASGDGYKFRGRGAIQLTGRENYTKFAQSLGRKINDTIDYIETLEGAIESACWFWKTNGLNAICDTDDIVKMTKRINGGTIGLEDRKKHYEHAKHVLGDGHSAPAAPAAVKEVVYETVRVGSNNETVKLVQQKLGLAADGKFGPGTEKAVKAWQTANGLTADGIVGPASLKKMLG